MIRLQIIITKEVASREEAAQKLASIKSQLKGAGAKMSASVGEMLQKPEDV